MIVQRKKRTEKIEQILLEQHKQRKLQEDAFRMEMLNKDKRKPKKTLASLNKAIAGMKDSLNSSGVKTIQQFKRYNVMVVNKEYFLERGENKQSIFAYRKSDKTNDVQQRLKMLSLLKQSMAEESEIAMAEEQLLDDPEADKDMEMTYNTQRTTYQYFDIKQRVLHKMETIPEKKYEGYSSDDSDDMIEVEEEPEKKPKPVAKNAKPNKPK
jgi:hypothetical protein